MIHFKHLWISSQMKSSFSCMVCSAEVTYCQFESYPFLSYYTTDKYNYWYDVVCDEIWNRLKKTGYMRQRIKSENPEKMKPFEWEVEIV